MAIKPTSAYNLEYVHNPQAADASNVAPSDTVDLTKDAIGLFVGGAGAIKVKMASGTELTITGVVAGTILPLIVKRVFLTGTTATNIVAFH